MDKEARSFSLDQHGAEWGQWRRKMRYSLLVGITELPGRAVNHHGMWTQGLSQSCPDLRGRNKLADMWASGDEAELYLHRQGLIPGLGKQAYQVHVRERASSEQCGPVQAFRRDGPLLHSGARDIRPSLVNHMSSFQSPQREYKVSPLLCASWHLAPHVTDS